MFMLKGVRPEKYAERVKSEVKSENTNVNLAAGKSREEIDVELAKLGYKKVST
jgi:hypothetical protein